MNLIELLIVLASVNSAVPLAAGPLTQVREDQVVREGLVRCHCMPEDHFKAKVATRNSTSAGSSVVQLCGMLKGLDQ